MLAEDDWLLDREEARCSRSRRRRRRAEERSRASALRPDADRLARRAFAWLEETVREGKFALKPGTYGSMMPVVLVPKDFK